MKMRNRNHRLWLIILLAFAAAVPVAAQGSRMVVGQVLDADGNAVNGAIVVLVNRETKKETSVVTKEEGRYRFGGLDATVDYRVYAKKDGLKSRARGISSFASRNRFVIDLSLKPAKESDKTGSKKSDGSL